MVPQNRRYQFKDYSSACMYNFEIISASDSNGGTIPSGTITITLTAAFVARFVEQLFGSPTPGGVLIFWILTGALAAMLVDGKTEVSKKRVQNEPFLPIQYAAYAGVVVIIIGSIAIGWDKGANYLIANQQASLLYQTEVVPADEAIKRLEKIVKLAPDVPRYWNDLAQIEHGRAAATDNPTTKAESLSKAYEYDLKG